MVGRIPKEARFAARHDCRANAGREQIARHAGMISTSRRRPSHVDKGKGYDDPIESGIAFFTALLFIQGEHHVWGDGSDGTIVGPGRMRTAKC